MALTVENLIQLAEMTGFFILTLIGVSIYRCVWRGLSEWYDAINRATIAGTTIFLAMAFSGGISYVLQQLGLVNIAHKVARGLILKKCK